MRITDCTITHNEALPYGSSGGGVYCENGSPVISGCTISFNLTDQWSGGGGVYSPVNTYTTIRDCWIEGNRGVTGGGVVGGTLIANSTVIGNTGSSYGVSGTRDVLNCTIKGNDGGGVGNVLNVIACTVAENGMGIGTKAGTLITDCTIVSNRGSGILCSNDGSMTVSNCLIQKNGATSGAGATCNGNSQVSFSHCVFDNNVATNDGAGLLTADAATVIVTNSVFTSNYAGRYGGAVYAGSWVALVNCAFRDNTAQNRAERFAPQDAPRP